LFLNKSEGKSWKWVWFCGRHLS